MDWKEFGNLDEMKKSWKEFFELQYVRDINVGYIYCTFTDQLYIDRWNISKIPEYMYDNALCKRIKESNFSKLLECRIFNENQEFHMIRTDLRREWKMRYVYENDDKADKRENNIDKANCNTDLGEEDSKNIVGYNVRATGGGQYYLPVCNIKNLKIRIKNYIGYYSETGQAYVKDWRLVSFVQDNSLKYNYGNNEMEEARIIKNYIINGEDRTKEAEELDAYYEEQYLDIDDTKSSKA